jgi:hypothetical protein
VPGNLEGHPIAIVSEFLQARTHQPTYQEKQRERDYQHAKADRPITQWIAEQLVVDPVRDIHS